MPYSSPNDPDIPQRIRTFWGNINATASDKRKWVHVFNSCIKDNPGDESKCFQMATGTVSRDIRKRRGQSLSLRENLALEGLDLEVIGEDEEAE